MTFQECFEFLQDEFQRIEAKAPPVMAEQLIALEVETRERIDSHIRKLLGLGIAPARTPQDDYFLAQRFSFAVILMRALDAGGTPLKDRADRDWSHHLYWLLVDSWERAGQMQWELHERNSDAELVRRLNNSNN